MKENLGGIIGSNLELFGEAMVTGSELQCLGCTATSTQRERLRSWTPAWGSCT